MLQSSAVQRFGTRRSVLSVVGTLIGSRPATVFTALSLTFGLMIIFANPPLRGPDEIAHFLRIYSYSRGNLLPPPEINGRKGIFVERELYDRLYFLKNAGERFARAEGQLRYGQIMAEYRNLAAARGDAPEQSLGFAPFAGTEGYNPVSYVPYIAAAAIGRLLRLDFVDMLLLMRFFGLVAFTGVAGYAIVVSPAAKWAFVLIAMLPVSLYNRAVLSADGAALSYALAITALCLRAGWQPATGRVWERSLWMTLCALSKQPQIVFVLLELMVGRLKTKLPQKWNSFVIVALPGLIMSPLWVLAVSADIAAWRLLEGRNYPPEYFDPLWKLSYMWEHPYHFPLAMWAAISGWAGRLWQELLGIAGWQDILLPNWIYLLLTALLLLVPLQKTHLSGAARARLTVITGLTILSYIVLVYLIFFLIYTPIDLPHIQGVIGRYFVIALPVAAICLAAMLNLELPRDALAAIATTGSLLAGAATVEAVLRAHW
jgi:uncharacterized membrane protein